MTVAELAADLTVGARDPGRHWLLGRQAMAGATLLVIIVLIALVGPLVAPHAPDAPLGTELPGAGPGHGALLGTDFLGRDILSRVLCGGLPVLALATVTVLFTYVVAGLIGMTAGLARSLIDPLLMRAVDMFLAFPPLLLILVLITGAGTGPVILAVAIVAVLFPGATRIIRTATLEVSTTGYIEAAAARGERTLAIMWREVLPNIAPVVLADLGVRFTGAIVLAASVNYLGLGSKPPTANWAVMIAENREIIPTNIWAVLAPAMLLAMLTISVNLLGDAYVRSRSRTAAVR